MIPLSDGSAVKTTTSKILHAKGQMYPRNRDYTGCEVELTKGLEQKTTLTHEEDNQLQKAMESCERRIEVMLSGRKRTCYSN